MKRVIAKPGWGNLIIEDDATGELSLQCLGGGFAMRWQRVVLTRDESAALRGGKLDIDAMVREVNHHDPGMATRVVPAYEIADLDDSG